jgi:hypothetical protein
VTALVVAGGGIAALVAADAAAAAGRDVHLLLPRKGVGGGFMPIVLDGRPLERGLRVLELGYEGVGTPPPLHTYDAAGAGHRAFARDIDAYVRSVAGDDAVVRVPAPQMWLNGRLGDELLLTSDLTRLRAYLDARTAAAIAAEARGEAGLLAPGRAGELAAASLTQASLHNHGRTFHDLVVAPVLAKLRPEAGDDVPADLRRKLWMALFHPRTLREAAAGGPVGFRPDRPFHDIEPGGPGHVVTCLLERLRACAHVTVTEVDGFAGIGAAPGRRVCIAPLGAAPVLAEDPILALTPGELFPAAGIGYRPDRVSSVLTWLQVAERDAEALRSFAHVVDADLPVFRVSRGAVDADGVTLCVELAHDVAKADASAVAADALRRIGVLPDTAPVRPLATFSGLTFTAPTFVNRERFGIARRAFDALGLRARTIGGTEAFGVDSFNEQVMQGLAAAAWAADAVAVAA